MAEIINLRQARKARARTEAEGRAGDNRVRFGRTKAEKQVAKSETERRERALEGVRRDVPSEPRDT
jgi:hypothetical protein